MSERTMQKEVQHKIRSNRLGTNKKVPELWSIILEIQQFQLNHPKISSPNILDETWNEPKKAVNEDK